MGNVLTNLYQTKVVPGLYQQMVMGSTSSWMENNAFGVDYRGGKYIDMFDMSVDGLGNYDRNLGYPRGTVTGSKKQYELTMDRGREFLIDAADNDETNFLVTGASVMATFQRDHVIPEVDCYRYSKIYKTVNEDATYGSTNVNDDAIAAADITDVLVDDIANIQDELGDVPLVIIMSRKTQKYFGRDFDRSLDVINFMRGTINTKVKSIDGNPFLLVPSSRLKTAYTFRDGTSSGQTAGGYTVAAGAKDMKWIITPVTAPIAVTKIDKPRAFTPDEYQGANAWSVDYRLYHDLWMKPDGIKHTFIRTGNITTA